MHLRILGCSGGIGRGLRTSSYLIDDDILLDAGTGVGDLTLDEMRKLKHIFITHSHMDHIVSISLLLDTLFADLKRPLIIHARQQTIDAIKQHVFNWVIWPDFTELPSAAAPVVEFRAMQPGDEVEIDGRCIEMIAVNHTVPAAAYTVKTARKVLVYSGDTTTNDNLWRVLNLYPRLDFMIVECAFANHDLELAKLARHFCPSLLADDLKKLRHRPKTGISHLKPGEESRIMQECRAELSDRVADDWALHQLSSGDHFQI
jgi:cAMP phosphodiesterase